MKIVMHLQLEPGINLVNVRTPDWGQGKGRVGNSDMAYLKNQIFTSLGTLPSYILTTKL